MYDHRERLVQINFQLMLFELSIHSFSFRTIKNLVHKSTLKALKAYIDCCDKIDVFCVNCFMCLWIGTIMHQ